MTKLSVVINTLNEEKHIEECIKSVKAIADEIIVVDMHSDDKTVKIAKSAGAKVFDHPRVGYVEPARNFAISKASGEWILILDADERLSKTLRKKIKIEIKKDEKSYFTLPRKNIIFDKWIEHTGWWPDYNIRLFKRGSVVWGDEIHSIPMTNGVGGDFEPKEENAIVHYNYVDVESFLNRLNKYTSIQGKERFQEMKTFEGKSFIKSPVREFVTRYFKYQGYKDGLHGLALSLLQAFSEFVVEIKVWQHYKFETSKVNINESMKTIREAQSEINYWVSDTLIKETDSTFERIRRKFKV